MKKTITINIAGLVFNIEEDAYSVLKEYLEKIGNKFDNLEERQEIVEDIEARIAELFSEKLNRNKEVINEKDVSKITEIMGSPDNFEGDETEAEETTEKQSTSSTEKKKLFRDGDNKVVAGVCAGVSNYFGWNISIVRSLFALLILIGGTGFWVYILAWIIIPEAKSTSEKLAMKGKNATVDNIEKFVKSVRNIDTSNVSESVKRQSDKFNKFLVGTSKKIDETLSPKKHIYSFLNVLFSVLGTVFISIGIIIVLSLIYGILMPESDNELKLFLSKIHSDLNISLSDYVATAIALIIFIISSGFGLIILGLRLINHNKHELLSKLSPVGTSIRFVIILSFASTIILFNLNTKLRINKYSYHHNQDIHYKTIVLKKLPNLYNTQHKENINFNIKKTENSVARIEISKYAAGLSSDKMNNKRTFDYKISDSIIYMSPTINYDNGVFNKKEVKITLYIPDNDSVQVIDQFSE